MIGDVFPLECKPQPSVNEENSFRLEA